MRGLIAKDREFTSFINGEPKKFKIVKPNMNQGNKADLIYKKHFNEAIREGLPTTAQLKDSLSSIEFFNKTNKAIVDIDIELSALLEQLENLKDEDKDKGLELSSKIKEMRARRFIEVFKIHTVYDNTAENYAEAIRNQFYAAELLRDEAGKKVFTSFEDFKENQSNEVAQDAIINVMMFMARLEDNYQMEYPENKWLVKNKIMNEEGDIIDSELFVEEKQSEGNIEKVNSQGENSTITGG